MGPSPGWTRDGPGAQYHKVAARDVDVTWYGKILWIEIAPGNMGTRQDKESKKNGQNSSKESVCV